MSISIAIDSETHLVVVPVAGEVKMVEPYLRRGLDANSITSIRKDLGDLDVTDNDILFVQDTKSNTDERCE